MKVKFRHIMVLAFYLCVVGCGQGPTIVTKRDANSSGTVTQAMAKKHNEEEESLSVKFEATKQKAEQGDEVSQFNLGKLYYLGEGVEKDLKEAMKWFRKAAEQGYGLAQNNLGSMYLKGIGVEEKDDKEAMKWFRKAADQGIALAQYNLGLMYGQRRIKKEQDYWTAYAWLSIAATNGSIEAKGVSNRLTLVLTPVQISHAEELVKEMIKKTQS